MLYETKSVNDSVCVVLKDTNYTPYSISLQEYFVKTINVGYTYNSTDGRHMETILTHGVLLHIPGNILSYIRLLTDIDMIFNLEDIDNLIDQIGSKFSIN
jgi:hypothetical protein